MEGELDHYWLLILARPERELDRKFNGEAYRRCAKEAGCRVFCKREGECVNRDFKNYYLWGPMAALN